MSTLIHVYASLQTLVNLLITHSTQLLVPVNAAKTLRHWNILLKLRLTQ